MIYRSIKIEKGTPGYAAVNPNTNRIYICYPSSNFITVVNLDQGTIENKIQLISPGNVCVNGVTNKVYIPSAYGICEIDGINNQYEMINIGLPRSDGSVAVNPLTNMLYSTCFGHDILTVIEVDTRAIADKIPVGQEPRGVAVDTRRNNIYVANNVSQSISVIDGNESKRLPDIYIRYKHGKYQGDSTLNPKFIIVNESHRLLYVKIFEGYVSAYGAYQGQALLVINIDTGKEIKDRKLPSNVHVGFAYDGTNNSLYMKKNREMAVIKLDPYARNVLNSRAIENRSFWQRFYEDFSYFAEVIAVNPSTNKVYISDSLHNLLYEIEG